MTRQAEELSCCICGFHGGRFQSFGVNARSNARCPGCGSLERHRLYFIFLTQHFAHETPRRILHVAPEPCLAGLLRSAAVDAYVSIDLSPGRAMRREDLCRLSFEDDSFDFVFCSHVLEHVPDDLAAMRELRRVVRRSGTTLLQVPLDVRLSRTHEDPSITDPSARERAFGQKDHVRRYGADYVIRLVRAGFVVSIVPYFEMLPTELRRHHGLAPELLFLCAKP